MNAAEVLSVLNSTELQSLEAEIARAVNLPVQKDDHMKDEQRLAKLFTFLQLSIDDIRTCLTRDRAALVRFGVAIQGRPMIIDDGEFPKGLQQPSPDAGKPYVALGIGHGFALDYLCYWHILAADDRKRPLEFLKLRRIPGAKKFLSELTSYYESSRNP